MIREVCSDLLKKITFWLQLLCLSAVLIITSILAFFSYYGRDLPDYRKLENYNPHLVSRVYSGEGKLMKEYALEKRIYIEYAQIPKVVVQAFLSAEDKNYFQHQGLDYLGIVRAAIHNILNLRQGGISGGSTITQQVVKNFLLTNERTISRKVKEAILAYRVSQVYSKEKILELYMNQIFLGNNSYGLVCGASNYFNKDVSDLTIDEAAMLAAMPQAPSNINPVRNPHRAKLRRDWVINRMLENNYINEEEATKSIATPMVLAQRNELEFARKADFYNEAVRLELLKKYTEKDLYTKGFTVITNMNEGMQKIATASLRAGLLKYDRAHGYRGPLDKLSEIRNWQKKLSEKASSYYSDGYELAAVIGITPSYATIGFPSGTTGKISLEQLKWARKPKPEQSLGPPINKCSEVLHLGDIILVNSVSEGQGNYSLAQTPEVDGGIMVMEISTGKVIAMVGGYNFSRSSFNRVTQAGRQPGSAFKPIVYLAALEHGYQPNTIVQDSPISIPQGPGMPMWTPKNYKNEYLGPITLRRALERSRNVSTARVAFDIGLDPIVSVSERLGIFKDPPKSYSIALGAYETTLLKLGTAYSVIGNGGMRVVPRLVSEITDHRGKILEAPFDVQILDDEDMMPNILRSSKQLLDPALSYQMTSMLEGVVQRGSAVRARQLNRPIAGKTGTTNDSFDSWFIGYTPDILVGVYVGFDQPKSLGQKETGSSIALPIFIDFMQQAMAGVPPKVFPIPEGIELREINSNNGQVPNPEYTGPIIKESFRNNSDADEIIENGDRMQKPMSNPSIWDKLVS